MSNKLYNEQSVQDIADAIRSVSGSSDTYTIGEMSAAVAGISTGLDWAQLGYDTFGENKGTPAEIVNGFNYAKSIIESYTSASTYSNDTKLMFWPNIDITGRYYYETMFAKSNLIHCPPLTLGDSSHLESSANLKWAFRETRIEDIELSTINNNAIPVSCSNAFLDCKNLKTVKFNCEVGAIEYMFSGCTSLTTVNNFTHNISSVVVGTEAFKNCSSLVTAPTITNFGSITAMNGFFNGCTLLENIPVYDTSAITSWSNAFANCTSLTDTSLDNILQMCIGATSYNGTKKLSTLGVNSIYDSIIPTLDHYNDFITAGWIIR